MALRRLTLKDFAIVDSLDLEFEPGFSVLTGETGAGKSILIDALQLVLGGRAETTMVREGAHKADLCAEFNIPVGLGDWLNQAGIEADGSLLLRRTIDNEARNRAWINGTPATAAQLKQLGEFLLDIHGQHAWQGLMQPQAVRDILDAFGKISTKEVALLWNEWQAKQKQLTAALAQQASQQTERDRLQWQISELEKLSPKAREWVELEEQHARLSHAESLLETADAALTHLAEEPHGVCTQLGKALLLLERQSTVEPSFQGHAEVLSSCLAQIDDVRHSLKNYLQHADLDPDRLREIDGRMADWMGFARRFRRKPEELADTLASWKETLAVLDKAVDIDALEHEAINLSQRYDQAAKVLSTARKRHATRLAETVTHSMQTLGMEGGRFEVAFATVPPSALGTDSITFLVATNPGSTPKPLIKIASGGELSRLSLAISVATSAQGAAQSLIFDEVDSGIGGHVAETVGKLLHSLGEKKQILAVTHLPQIAIFADHHFQVTKAREAQRSVSKVQKLSAPERLEEIARMLGGKNARETSLAHAREMLHQAHELSSETRESNEP